MDPKKKSAFIFALAILVIAIGGSYFYKSSKSAAEKILAEQNQMTTKKEGSGKKVNPPISDPYANTQNIFGQATGISGNILTLQSMAPESEGSKVIKSGPIYTISLNETTIIQKPGPEKTKEGSPILMQGAKEDIKEGNYVMAYIVNPSGTTGTAAAITITQKPKL